MKWPRQRVGRDSTQDPKSSGKMDRLTARYGSGLGRLGTRPNRVTLPKVTSLERRVADSRAWDFQFCSVFCNIPFVNECVDMCAVD